jgi:hypothetical protein
MAPARAIDPAEMKAFFRHVFLLDVVGPEIVGRYGEELTGRYLDEIDLDDVDTDILGEYQRALRDAMLVRGQWSYERRSGHYLNYERIMLPLSSDGRSIDMLVCGAPMDGVQGLKGTDGTLRS